MTAGRSGAQALIEQLIAGEVSAIFGNPGTTEQIVIDCLQDYPGLELILALHEGVAVGAADGYARATGKVGVAELHAGPGLGNGLGNLYNAYVSHTPLLVYAGQSEHDALYQEPVLSGDLVGMARPLTKWAYEVHTAAEIPQVVRRALAVALTPPCGPVLLAVPLDLTAATCEAPVITPDPVRAALRPDPAAIAAAATALAAAQAPVLVLGDAVATSGAVDAVSRLASLLGAPVFEGAAFETVTDTQAGLYGGRIPGDPAGVARWLDSYDCVIAIGTRVLAQLFPARGLPLGDRALIHIGADAWELGKNQPGTIVLGDERAAVEQLTDSLDECAGPSARAGWLARGRATAQRLAESRDKSRQADLAARGATPMAPAQAIAALAGALPADAIIIDEAMSAYELVARHVPRRPGQWFRGAGGIGMGLPRAVGVQVARPGRPVVGIIGDGASMYSLTALWTAAHHDLPIVSVILNNRSYRTLKQNTLKARSADPAGRVFVGADLTDPDIDFVSLARGFGVAGTMVSKPDDIEPALTGALASGRPALIDVRVSPAL